MAYNITSGRFYGPPGGSILTYAAGTLTPLATYTTAAGDVANPTTITIPASGYVPVWGGAGLSYRFIVKDATGVTVYDQDNITDASSSAEAGIDALTADLASVASVSVGAGMIGYSGGAYAAGTIGAAVKRFDPSLPPWNADKTGAVDASTAIQACADAAGTGGLLVFSPGTYRINSTIKLRYDYQSWMCYGVLFDFRPTSASTAVEIKSASAGQSIWGAVFAGARITSPDSLYVKTAVDVVDARIMSMRDITVTGSVVHSGSNFFSDSTSSSIGIRIRGREIIDVSHIYVAADLPIRIDGSPNTSIVGVDHCQFTQLVLLAHQNPGILISSGTILTQSGFKGLSVNLAREGIKWIDSTGTTASNGMFIHDMRAEQPESTSYAVIDIRHTSTVLQGLAVRGGFCNQVGPYLRGVENVSFDDWYHGTTDKALDVDATVSGIDVDNCFWQAGSTASIAGQRVLFETTKLPNTAPLSPTFRMQPSSNTKRNMVLGGAIGQEPVTIANNAVLTLENNIGGLFSITDDRGLGAVFVVHGTNGVSELVSTTTSAAYFSNTATTASKTNVYWTGAAYAIENKTGASRNYRFALLGSYGTF